MKVLYVVNEAQFYLSHRLAIGQEAQRRGCDVVVVSAPKTGEERLADHGFRHIPVRMSRSGFNLLEEYGTYRALARVYESEQPDLVHHITIKPVLYGSIAARRRRVPAVVNAVPGTGFLFIRSGLRASMVRSVVNFLYRRAFEHPNLRVIFQNADDLREFISHKIVDRANAVLIRGSGVRLEDFEMTPSPPEPPVFVLLARMLKDKGVYEFAQAAAQIKETHPDWRFVLAGDLDPGNPSSLTDSEIVEIQRRFGVEWMGFVENVADLLKDVHVVCQPTYSEGLPKTLLEASAAGRPMIASDIPGCREVVTEGVTGYLVPPRTIAPLVEACLKLGDDETLRNRMGDAARQKAEAVFSVDDVVDHTFRVYGEVTTI